MTNYSRAPTLRAMATLAKRDVPSPKTLRANIRAVYDRATAQDLAAGRAWYRKDAARVCADMVDLSGGVLTRNAAARIIAALSPRLRWSRNVEAALQVARNLGTGAPVSQGLETMGLIRANVAKAERIAAGDLAALGSGPKTNAFAANLSGDLSAVTVDVWALRVALGESEGTWEGPAPAAYSLIAAAYIDVARAVGETPADLQAITWGVLRGNFA